MSPLNKTETQTLSVSLLDTNAFQTMQKEWNRLLQTSPANTIFLTWEWTYTWWQVYGHAHQLFLLKIQDEHGTCVGLAPLKISRRYTLGVPYRQVEFIGYCRNTFPDYLDFIFAPGYQDNALLAVWAYLMNHKHLYDTLYFCDIPTASSTHSRLNHFAQEGGYVRYLDRETICPYLPIETSWETYLKSLSQNQRYNMQRKEKRITKSHQMDFEEVFERSDSQKALEEMFDLHKEVWNAKGEQGSFDGHPLNKIFHRRIVDQLSELGRVVIYTLKIDGKTAALLYAYAYNNQIFYYQMGRATQWSEYGIGQVLMKFILQSLFKKGGITAFYFLRGTESYKYHWTKSEHINRHLCIWNQTLWGKIVCFMAQIDRSARKALRPMRRIIEKALSK